VDKLKSRFDTRQQARGETEEHSQAFYLILAAQKKENLKREGGES
jgi:hypothetical protein